MKILLIIVIATLFLSGCSSIDNRTNKDIVREDTFNRLTRYEDNEYEVMCWQATGANKGLSCLPKNQLIKKD